MLVFDLTDRDSFTSLRYWLNEVEKHAQPGVTTILVGNKLDLAAQRKVTYDEGFNFGMTLVMQRSPMGCRMLRPQH